MLNALSQPNENLCIINTRLLHDHGKPLSDTLEKMSRDLEYVLEHRGYNLIKSSPYSKVSIEDDSVYPQLPFEKGEWLSVDVITPHWLSVVKMYTSQPEKYTLDLYVTDYAMFVERLQTLLEPLAEHFNEDITDVITATIDYAVCNVYDQSPSSSRELVDYLRRSLDERPLSILLDEIEGHLSLGIDPNLYYLHFVDAKQQVVKVFIEKEETP